MKGVKKMSNLPAFEITYSDGSKSRTSMAAGITLDEARKYFVGEWFNIGSFPDENMQRAVDVVQIRRG
jgi:hypothetical protein